MCWRIEGRCLDFSQWAEGRFRFWFIYLLINYMLNQSQRTMSQLDLHCCSSCAVVPSHCLTDACTHTRLDEPRDCRLIFVTLLQKLLREVLCMLRSQWYGKAS